MNHTRDPPLQFAAHRNHEPLAANRQISSSCVAPSLESLRNAARRLSSICRCCLSCSRRIRVSSGDALSASEPSAQWCALNGLGKWTQARRQCRRKRLRPGNCQQALPAAIAAATATRQHRLPAVPQPAIPQPQEPPRESAPLPQAALDRTIHPAAQKPARSKAAALRQ